MAGSRLIIIGVSGPSSSGKSTLGRLLHHVLPKSFILYEDDFYKPEEQIPIVNGELDWDCPEAIDFVMLRSAVDYVRTNHCLQDGLYSKEDKNALGKPPVTLEEADEIKKQIVGQNSEVDEIKFCIVDGFLLFIDEELTSKLDVKLLLRAPYESLKARREARNGYATLEGFWQDPPGYFEKIVWPGYVKAHKHLFVNGDMNGDLTEAAKAQDIRTASAIDLHMSDLLRWALKTISQEVNKP
ncbi:P-loop containing nucleoside triphosphate hydrolase protein [Lipomyces arxii]|uniref:P-loop containing nucleoside triphosphate hydrolase protein n=1 Tax=Lipomyces arxii TaxID=56418 RepID=UPI0034CF75E8